MNAAFAAEKPSSFARTNTDSSGYVTNANLLTPFTVTNSAGVVFTNAVLVKLMPNKFIYKTPGGAMGTLRLDALPEDLLQKIGYDPQAAQAANSPSKKTLPEVPDASSRPDLEIVSLSTKVMEANALCWRWSYQLKAKNNTAQPLHEFPSLLFLDAEGFIIDKTLCEVKLSAGETKTFLGTTLVYLPGAARVKTIKVE